MTQKVYLYFSDSSRWWRHALKKGFSHVAVILDHGQMKNKIVLESYDCGLWTWGVSEDYLKDLNNGKTTSRKTETGTKILEVTFCKPVIRKRFTWLVIRWGVFSCVFLPNYLLGLSPVAWTPAQLYRRLTSKKLRKNNHHIMSVRVINVGGK